MTPEAVLSGEARWAVLDGDCADWLGRLPNVDALVTDPPYGIGEARSKAKARNRTSRKWKFPRAIDYGREEWDDVPPDSSLLDALRAKARTQVVFGGNYFHLPPSSCWLVWDKLNGESDFADCELAWTNMNRAVRRIAYRWNGFSRENKEPRGQHPTQKPVGVMMWALGLSTQPGDLVLDPFCGSGTTGVAALRMGRRFIGIEREPHYAAVARERLAAETQGLTLEAARAGQLSLLA